MLSGQQQVSMQEAVHMVDNQELDFCSDKTNTSVWHKDKLYEMRMTRLIVKT